MLDDQIDIAQNISSYITNQLPGKLFEKFGAAQG